MGNIFKQYGGLRREAYVLFFGRMMTCLGSTVNSMMSLILANKMGKSAYEIATIFLLFAIAQLPIAIIGGKIADKFNKRNIIICCDIVTIVAYFVAGMMQLSDLTIVILFIGAGFANMEFPSYDALVADFTQMKDRERAYSLNYLAANVGIVLAPIIGGVLFENFLNISFIVNSIATLSSTILIFFLIKDVRREISPQAVYEESSEHTSIFTILKSRKILVMFIFCSAIATLVYAQYSYLIPLNLEQLYQAKGALYFGFLTSLNAIVVVVGTPILTILLKKIHGTTKIVLGEIFITVSFAMYIFIQGIIPLYFVSMVLFIVGEIMSTLGNQPYLTQRIPATHRGRISSLRMIVGTGFQTLMQLQIGKFVDNINIIYVWVIIVGIGTVSVLCYTLLRFLDKRSFPKLYERD